jgi:hypothetical protein
LRWRNRGSAALDLEVFPEASLRSRCESRTLSSRRVAPPTECDRAVPSPPTRSRELADRDSSHGIWRPFDASSTSGATTPELASLRSLRSQGFSPSQRFAPRWTLRPCFMPVAPLGFVPSEPFPLEEPYRLSTAVALLMLTTHPRYYTTWSCHVKRAEARCPPPDGSGCGWLCHPCVIPPGASECLLHETRCRPKSAPGASWHCHRRPPDPARPLLSPK